MLQREQKDIVNDFHNLYYDGPKSEGHISERTYWMNVQCLKCPLDMWIYQEIVAETQPDLIVETGKHMGGSALFMAHMLNISGHGEIITIYILDYPGRPQHSRINYVQGSSADPALVNSLLNVRLPKKCMVILDSDHSKQHIVAEMALLAPYVSVGSYLIVEDTNTNGHPAYPSFGESGFEAVEEFLSKNQNFSVDTSKEKFLMTFNPSGYLKRMY
ncbi:cephalosporin hydroxylase [Leptolyngbya sp. FACHB-321]|uniref:CmcI family methyltransferase n=1 Tax=Leptolyngbya sp. FACHB-321 TaxID=2692807 RepID=UPI00168699A9|nr:CmcI family methyltransferase [Leptolyngbya sp. FACHB-321]MBD2035779.1 cephalosporin hydroxylase [Leptolyngbya sp. FACHB-321]